jgi:hypothetical protein
VIYDVDDALHFVRRSQLAWTSRPRTLRERAVVRYRQLVRGSRYHGSRFNALRQIVGLADATIFGNSFLVDQLGHWAQRIVTLPTCVPVEARPPKVHSQDLPIRIGWIGTGDNLPELDLIEQPLARLAQRFGDGVVLTVVSSRPYDTSAIQTEFDSWSLQTERASVLNFDIGIMPLADTPYTRGKCAFKAVQCMAQALPVVVSPVGLNADLVRDGINGFLANSSDMWLARLSELIQDLGLRTRLGQAAFEDVRAGYSTNFALPVLRDAIGLSVTGKTRR